MDNEAPISSDRGRFVSLNNGIIVDCMRGVEVCQVLVGKQSIGDALKVEDMILAVLNEAFPVVPHKGLAL
jgi:hypothetical protein